MAEPARLRVTPAQRVGLPFLVWLAGLTLIRLGVAALMPLAPDEAYYWVFSRALAAGYPDHPPMVALWIRAGTAIAGDGTLGVRLLGPLAAALGAWMLLDAAKHLPLQGQAASPAQAAPLLLSATLLMGGNAVIMTPDAPLLLFWTACLWALARLLADGRPAWWLAIGLFAGLALVSKYTGLLLWLGIAAWLLWVPSQRHWWRSPWLWAGSALGALVFLPVMAWNATHGWASFLRQGGRVANWQPARAAQFLAELVGGQIGLATPLLFVLFVAGSGLAVRLAWRYRDPGWSLLAAMTLPGTLLFLQHAVGDRVQGNWPAILYPAAALAAAGLRHDRWLRLHRPAITLGLLMTAGVYLLAVTAWPLLPPRIDPIARQLAGWDSLAGTIDVARRGQAAVFVASDEYGVAAELTRALPRDVPMLGVEPRWALFRLPPAAIGPATGILVRSQGSGAPLGWRDVRHLGEVARASHGEAVQRFELWLVAGPDAAVPVVQLPRTVPGT